MTVLYWIPAPRGDWGDFEGKADYRYCVFNKKSDKGNYIGVIPVFWVLHRKSRWWICRSGGSFGAPMSKKSTRGLEHPCRTLKALKFFLELTE